MTDNNSSNLARIKCREIPSAKEKTPVFQVWVGGKKGGNQNFPKIVAGEPKPYTLCTMHSLNPLIHSYQHPDKIRTSEKGF